MTQDEETDAPRRESPSRPDPTASTVRVDWMESRQPSVAVVNALAEATGRDPLEIDPLHEYVESQALDALVMSSVKSESRSAVCVSFSYEGCAVRIGGNGEVTVAVESSDHE